MKILGPFLVALLICTWIGGRPAAADGWGWAAEHDGAPKHNEAQRSQSPPGKPWNPLAPIDVGVKGIDRGLKKLGNDTKRFFTTAGEALRLKRPAPQRRPGGPHIPWIRPARPETPSDEKPSWLGSLFRREDPRPSTSIDDFLDSGRLDP